MAVLKRLCYALASVALAVAFLIAATEVVSRYFLGVSHSAGHEIVQWLLVAGVMLCAGPALDDGVHVGVDQLVRYLPRPVQTAVGVVTELCSLAFALVLAWQGVGLVAWAMRLNERSLSELESPMWVPYLLVPVGGTLLSLFQAAALVRRARGDRPQAANPHEVA